MTWDAYHRRNDALRKVASSADRRRDGVLPWGEYDTDQIFDSADDLLLALQMRWTTRLRAYVHAELDEQPVDLAAAAARAWRLAAADLPGTRAILDAQEANPALGPARAKELAFLASAAGLADVNGTEAQLLGRRIRTSGRSITLERQGTRGRGPRLLRRLREAVAA
ncbi:hypothetical protein MU582_06245 [Nocardioidaceae bacterium SCSIO 66511]|nr:hypothetical protein MU582_06245 [Nocardioidaceae bacterium SCSIO 66511]